MTFLLVFLALGAAWALQMYLAGCQARAFMAAVAELRSQGSTAIGVSSTKRVGRKHYVALAADEADRVVGARQLSGVTVWARPRPLPGLEGLTLAGLASQADAKPQLAAAAMAASTLLAAHDTAPADAKEVVDG